MLEAAFPRGSQLAQRAEHVIPGGLNSFSRFLGPPYGFARSDGAYVWDFDGNRYIDYHAAFGAIVLGHNDPDVDRAVAAAMRPVDLMGVGITLPEVEFAELACEVIPSAEQMVACTSGSEATFHAVRLARAVTGRRLIVKVQGGYHGWHDAVARNVISPPELAYGMDPMSAGILPENLEATLIAEFNDLTSLEELYSRYPEQIAAVIVEPIPHNVGALVPDPGYLEGLRKVTEAAGSLLVFDEVITGFRHALGGWQQVSGVLPDLTTFGKAVGNGFPVAGLAGRRELLRHFNAAGGNVLLAGTFTGHPMACAAAIATIGKLRDQNVFARTAELGQRMRAGMRSIIDELGIPAVVAGYGSVWCTYFLAGEVHGYRDLMRNDDERYKAFHRLMTDRGFLMLPMSLKRNHVSFAHTEADIDLTLEAARDVLKELLRTS
ncbi:aspartate aminotransferase family protein [Flindersiella endophytica]